ncbi:hypothetical protein C0Q70_13827 [Pomacea canaliculata]|uniref:Leucine-rich repeat-containing protein 74A n=1 Tax=Pomacea canaliculata TaxID=400727 RepID=A0A2T7NYA2_POMCA|nr:hypothetical protein C0Q70_13827 [Pomacea canaliculata]
MSNLTNLAMSSGFHKLDNIIQQKDYDDDTYDAENESRSNSTASGGEKHSGSGDEVDSAIDGYRDGTAYGQKSKNGVKEKLTGSTQVSNAGYDVTGRLQQEEEGESVEHASMDDLSDVFIDEIQQLETRDEDFDTDLEIDDQKWLNPEKYDNDTTGLSKYLHACRQQNITPIRYFIKHMLQENVNLCYRGLGPVAMKALAVPLEINTSIEVLNLEGNWIGSEGAHHLCHVLKENVYITYLNLAENKLGNEGGQYVFDLLLQNRSLDWLDLTGNEIGDAAAENLGRMLKKNLTLRHLSLRHNHFEDTGAQWIKEALSDNTTLESLDISWNHFQTRGCVLIAEGLKENAGLKEVCLSMNGFGLEGAAGLGEAISANSTLRKLDASYCRLPAEGSASLARGLQANESLNTLNLGFNSLSPEGTHVILVGVEKNDNSSLQLLDLGTTKVSKEFKELQDKLASSRSLKVPWRRLLEALHKEVGLDLVEAFKATDIKITEDQINILLSLVGENDGQIDVSLEK